ncbi:hypothetical protein IQ07DRAFT_593175 [Pyrenochaeta sp. DS3sAY3a]|nr:hypothetical protein IQ07DRAFT_593175 [Pyrenochaeta sp. DS3sAY3a]
MGVMGGMEEATATASVTKESSGNGNTVSASGDAMGESGTIISGGKTTGTTSVASSSITGAPKHKRHHHEHLHKNGL